MNELVKRTAAGLVALGLKPKDVVLLLSPNNPDFAVVYLAVVSVGAVIAPCNPLNTEADIAKQLVQASARFVVTVPELLSKFGENIDALPTILIGKNKSKLSAFFSKVRVDTVDESSDCDRCVAIPRDSNNFWISMTLQVTRPRPGK